MKKLVSLLLAVCVLFTCVAAMAEDVIKIGIFEPMTGVTAGGGAMEREGFDLANKLFPEVLGKRVELVYGDNKSDRAEATLAAEALVQAGVVGVLGSYTSGLTMAGGEVFGVAEIPALTVSATNPTVTADCEWYARICFIDPFQGTMLARFCVEQGYKKIAIMCEKDSEYAVGLVRFFMDEMKKYPDFEVMDPVYFMNKDEDFSALLGVVLEGTPDVIFTPVSFADKAAQIMLQARNQHFTGCFIGGDTLDAPELFNIAGDAAVGAVFSTFYDANQPATEMTSIFTEAFRKEYGKEPSANAVMAFDGYLTMLHAIEVAGTTEPEALREALFNTSGFVGAAGVITLDENHDAVRPVVFKAVQADGSTAFVTIIEP